MFAATNKIMMKQIVIPYFPRAIRYATPLPAGLGIYLAMQGYLVWAIVMAVLIVVIFTTNYITEIDLRAKTFRDYLTFLTIPFQEEKVIFGSARKIVIIKENHSQQLNSRSRSRQLDWSSFTGMLVVDGDKKLILLTRTDKKDLIKLLKEFAEFLKVDIEDQTTSEHFVIDLKRY
jgi:hypothetical protein